jgi:hypothetical protein
MPSQVFNDFYDVNDADTDDKNDFNYDNDDDNAANNDFNDDNDVRCSWARVRTTYPATA